LLLYRSVTELVAFFDGHNIPSASIAPPHFAPTTGCEAAKRLVPAQAAMPKLISALAARNRRRLIAEPAGIPLQITSSPWSDPEPT